MIGPVARISDGRARWPALLAGFALGVVAAAGQAPFGLWPLALLGFAGGFFLILAAVTPGRAARLGWFFGAGYFGAALIWIVQPFMVDVARDGWMAPFALVLISFGLALFWALAAYVAARMVPGRGRRALMLAVCLTAVELARGYVFTGFPWALIGHIWIGTPVMQLAALGGAGGLSLLAMLAVALPFALGWRGAGGALVLIAAGWGYGAVKLAAPMPHRAQPAMIRLVQPDIAQNLKWRPDLIDQHFARQINLTADPAGPAPDMVIWPETAIPYNLNVAGPVLEQIAQAAKGVPVVLGVQRRDGVDFMNSLVAIDAQGQVTHLYDKHHLVPFGEYMPANDLFARIGVFGMAAGDTFGYRPGPGAQVLDFGALGKALPLICYEMVFPQDLSAAPDRADWIMQVTNDAWFGTFSGPYQHLAQARLRAVEQGLPVMRSANTGISAAIDARGRVLGQLPLNVAGQLTVALPAPLPPTVYARFGDWLILGALIVSFVLLVTVRWRNSVDPLQSAG